MQEHCRPAYKCMITQKCRYQTKHFYLKMILLFSSFKISFDNVLYKSIYFQIGILEMSIYWQDSKLPRQNSVNSAQLSLGMKKEHSNHSLFTNFCVTENFFTHVCLEPAIDYFLFLFKMFFSSPQKRKSSRDCEYGICLTHYFSFVGRKFTLFICSRKKWCICEITVIHWLQHACNWTALFLVSI